MKQLPHSLQLRIVGLGNGLILTTLQAGQVLTAWHPQFAQVSWQVDEAAHEWEGRQDDKRILRQLPWLLFAKCSPG